MLYQLSYASPNSACDEPCSGNICLRKRARAKRDPRLNFSIAGRSSQRHSGPLRELAAILIQSCDLLHVAGIQREVEDSQVFAAMVWVRGTRNGDHASLMMPAQDYLSYRFAVLFADLLQDRVGKEAIPPFREGRPCFHVGSGSLQGAEFTSLLQEWVRLQLVDDGLRRCAP